MHGSQIWDLPTTTTANLFRTRNTDTRKAGLSQSPSRIRYIRSSTLGTRSHFEALPHASRARFLFLPD